MIAPYVDEEVAWAIEKHQAAALLPRRKRRLRVIPRPISASSARNYKPEPYIVKAYEEARNHKWYMSSRLITLNDCIRSRKA